MQTEEGKKLRRIDLVTGAFGFTGKAIARRLHAGGIGVRTLTAHPERKGTDGESIEVFPYSFDDPDRLAESLAGVHTFYNTYWIRFEYRGGRFEVAVRNTRQLFAAARRAGVQRVVHVSIANACLHSPLPYYRGKAALENDLMESELSYAILRPTVMFGHGGILINNIAWLLRRFPIFGVIGDGNYRLQPVYIEDLAELALEEGGHHDNCIRDAAGPETYTYLEVVELLREAIGSSARIVRVPAAAVLALARVLGWLVGDILVTRDELLGLQRELLISHAAPSCPASFREWLRDNANYVGRQYLSEVALHYNRNG